MKPTNLLSLLAALLVASQICSAPVNALPSHGERLPSTRKTWGYIDVTGKFAIQPQFDSAESFSSGAAVVAPDDKKNSYFDELRYCYIDKNGKRLSPTPGESNLLNLVSGLRPINSGGLWGYANAKGEIAVKAIFNQAEPFVGRYAKINFKNHRAIIDTSGAFVWDEAAQPQKESEDGFCVVNLDFGRLYYPGAKNSGTSGVLVQGKPKLVPIEDTETNILGYIDQTGGWAIYPKFSTASKFSEGLAFVEERNSKRRTVIDETGKTRITLKSDVLTVSDFKDGLASFFMEAENLLPSFNLPITYREGVMDKSGKTVIPAKYSAMAPDPSSGLIAAAIGDDEFQKWGFIDKTGKVIIPFKYAYAKNFSEGLAAVSVANNKMAVSKAADDHIVIASKIDQEIRAEILKRLHSFKFDKLRISLSISHLKVDRVTIDKGVKDESLNKRIETSLANITLPEFPKFLNKPLTLSYVITPHSVFAGFTHEDPDTEKLMAVANIRKQLDKRPAHFEWQSRECLLESFLAIQQSLFTDPSQWSSEARELTEIYGKHNQSSKALALSETAYSINHVNYDVYAELLERTGNAIRAEIVLKEAIEDFKIKTIGIEHNVRPFENANIIALGNFYYRQKRFDEAEKIYRSMDKPFYLTDLNGQKVLRTELNDKYRLALFLLVTGKVAESETIFAELLEHKQSAHNDFSIEDDLLSYLGQLKEIDPTYFNKISQAALTKDLGNSFVFSVIDKQGNRVIKPNFDLISEFHDGLAPAQRHNRFGYIDETGKWKIWPNFGVVGPFREGLAVTSDKYEAFPLNYCRTPFHLQIIGTDGSCKISPDYFWTSEDCYFSEGLMGANMNSGYNDAGYINTRGEVVFGPTFHRTPAFVNGVAHPLIALSDQPSNVLNQNESYEIEIRPDGKLPATVRLNSSKRVPTDDELINPFFIVDAHGKRKWGYQDMEGSIVVEPKFDEAKCFYENLAAVRVKDLWGYIDKRGKYILPSKYASAANFCNSLAIVSDETNHFVDRDATDPFNGKYNSVNDFASGFAAVSKNGGESYGIIDRSGKEISEFAYRMVGKFSDGLVSVSKDGNYGYLNTSGKMVIQPIYLEAYPFHHGLAAVRQQFN